MSNSPDTEEEMRKETADYAAWVAQEAIDAPGTTANAADLYIDEDATDGDEDDDDTEQKNEED